MAVPITSPQLQEGSIGVGPGVAQIAPDGTIHLDADLRRENGFPATGDDDAYGAWLTANGYQDANLVIPGSAYWEVAGKEAVATLLVFVLSIGTSALLVNRVRLPA